MAGEQRERDLLVEAKLVQPVLGKRLVARPELEHTFEGLLREHRIVGVWASAGAGKTTAVAQAVANMGLPVAWLTLDPTDAAPGRFLVYLEAALSQLAPTRLTAASRALASGVVHPEAAALLAQAIPSAKGLLVIDELERIAQSPATMAAVSAFLRYLPQHLQVVLLGRREVQLDASRLGYGAIGRLGEEHLAFDESEAAAALALQGLDVDARRVVEATGGWVTGVLFEAWRSHDHVAGAGGEADPLAGYLAAEILDGLSEQEREFLVRTSLLDEVDAARARALGEENVEATLARLRDIHMPVTWREDGRVLRCHPRFRDYLRSLLDQREQSDVSDLRRLHGIGLAAAERYEDAVEELLAAGWIADAVTPAERALPGVIARLDLELAQTWLDRFASSGLLDRPQLLFAQLRVSIAREEFRQAVDAADKLVAIGALARPGPVEDEHSALAAWSYWHVGRLDDIYALLADSPDGHAKDVITYLCSLVGDEPPHTIPQLSGGPLDALILRISFVRGRLAEVRDAPVSEWTPAATERISAWRALGDLERTRRSLAIGATRLPNLRYETTAGPELLIDLGQEEEARNALLRGRTRIVNSGSIVFDAISRLLAAKLELRMRREATTALVILDGVKALGAIRDYGYIVEQLETWRGCALLLADRAQEARDVLHTVVASMSGADRILELPTAGVYLAEAESRLGDEDAAGAAAAIALDAAMRQGSRYTLAKAIEDVPSVLSRQLDSEAEVDGPWHEVARTLTARTHMVLSLSSSMYLRDLGTPMIIVAGEEHRARTSKSYALLALLIQRGGSAKRRELLEALFDGRADDSTGAYLRQAARNLRGLLPEGVQLLREGDNYLLEGHELVESDSVLAEARFATAVALTGTARLEALEVVVASLDRGSFLEGVDSAWVEQRRRELELLLADVQVEAAVTALDESHFEQASQLLARVLEEDPYRERAWRLQMRAIAAQGYEDRLIDTYLRCEEALGDAGLEPSDPTRLLFEGLRK